MATLKPVNPKTTDFSEIENGKDMYDYSINAHDKGFASVMFGPAHIPNSVYDEGDVANGELKTANDDYKDAPTPENHLTVLNKMALVVLWLLQYSGLVKVIANADTNRTTRLEAAENIVAAGLMYQKLEASSKGIPIRNVMTGGNIGTGTVKSTIVANTEFGPKGTTFYLISKAPVTFPVTPDAVVTLDENGQLKVVASYVYELHIINLLGKGRSATFTDLTPALGYNSGSFSWNGNKLIGKLPLVPFVVFG